VTKLTSLEWPDCLNVRDLGGLPSADGRRIAAGALIRSDNLTRLTAAGIDIMREARLGRIVDVRSAAECEHDPSPFAVNRCTATGQWAGRAIHGIRR